MKQCFQVCFIVHMGTFSLLFTAPLQKCLNVLIKQKLCEFFHVWKVVKWVTRQSMSYP